MPLPWQKVFLLRLVLNTWPFARTSQVPWYKHASYHVNHGAVPLSFLVIDVLVIQLRASCMVPLSSVIGLTSKYHCGPNFNIRYLEIVLTFLTQEDFENYFFNLLLLLFTYSIFPQHWGYWGFNIVRNLQMVEECSTQSCYLLSVCVLWETLNCYLFPEVNLLGTYNNLTVSSNFFCLIFNQVIFIIQNFPLFFSITLCFVCFLWDGILSNFSLKNITFYAFIFCMCVCVRACLWRLQESALLPSCEPKISNSGCQAWQQTLHCPSCLLVPSCWIFQYFFWLLVLRNRLFIIITDFILLSYCILWLPLLPQPLFLWIKWVLNAVFNVRAEDGALYPNFIFALVLMLEILTFNLLSEANHSLYLPLYQCAGPGIIIPTASYLIIVHCCPVKYTHSALWLPG